MSERNIPKVSQMAASKGNGLDGRRKHTGLSPEKNTSLEEHQAFQRGQASQRSQKHTSQRAKVYAVSDRSNGTLRHSQLADLQHSSVGKLCSRRSTTEVKNIRNESNGHPPEENFEFLDKYGEAICNLRCISEIENIEEKFEDDKVHGPDVEDLFYMSLKVKIKRVIRPHHTRLIWTASSWM